MAVILIGTLDTKGIEVGFVRDLLAAKGIETLVIDAGSLDPPRIDADIARDRVFSAAGTTLDDLRASGDRGFAVAAASRGVEAMVRELAIRGQVDGVIGLGGSAGTMIGTSAMRALPFGVPKVMVSTLASGQVGPFVGGSDIFMLHSVVDVAGLNRLTRAVLGNAANAMSGMIARRAECDHTEDESRLIAATMFGVTTPCVDRARKALETQGWEVLVFHATGVGGRAMEGLIRDGRIAGVLDLTTTELADELVGGILSAGPDRLESAGRAGIPQVVSVGALDMVNFGPLETVPERFRDRLFHVHNANVTLMRTTPSENAEIGRRMAEILSRAMGPTTVILPLGGVSGLDLPGKPFHDPEADAALFGAIRSGLSRSTRVRLIERPESINDPSFADASAEAMRAAIGGGGRLAGHDRRFPM
jgi:uncharacterized protein (UPF0261 family)